MTKLAMEHKAINLSQGFPDFDGPQWIKDLAIKYINAGFNQYAPSPGILSLRKVVTELFSKNYQVEYDANSEVTITNGATEAIFCTIAALTNPGDEVIIFEPFYDSYKACIELAGAKAIPVTLKYELDFSFDRTELEKAFSAKTKLIIINTPHNPTGKIFNIEELNFIAKLVTKNDCYCMSDEVYEFLVFDKEKHIPVCKIEGLKDRTVTISSIGKTFGLTGWKIGWALAPPKLTHAIRMIHQFNTFSVCHPIQHAVRDALLNIHEYLPVFKKNYQNKRDLFLAGLKELDYKPFCPSGTYFVMVPIPVELGMNDVEYCTHLIKEKKVAAIPPSSFYLKSNQGNQFIRFCFAKEDETLRKALINLAK